MTKECSTTKKENENKFDRKIELKRVYVLSKNYEISRKMCFSKTFAVKFSKNKTLFSQKVIKIFEGSLKKQL